MVRANQNQPKPASTSVFEPAPPAIVGERSREVAALFAIETPTDARTHRRPRCPIDLPCAGQLMLLTGASGSGKSSVVRALRRRATRDQSARTQVIDLRHIRLREQPVVELFPADATLEHTLKRLARVGLAEVWTWLRPPSQLSEGQRWRLRLALAIERVDRSESPLLLICDEFAAVLDRVTACVVSSVLRRTIDTHADRLAAVVATSQNDLETALAPDWIVECDFGRLTVARKDGAS